MEKIQIIDMNAQAIELLYQFCCRNNGYDYDDDES